MRVCVSESFLSLFLFLGGGGGGGGEGVGVGCRILPSSYSHL